MSESISSPYGIQHLAVTVAAGLMLLGTNIIFRVTGNTANNGIVQQWESPIRSHGSGAITGGNAVAYVTSSGSLVMSGSLIVKPSSGTGYVKVSGAASTFCMKNTAGTKEIVTIVSTTLTVRPAVAADNCP